MHKTKVDLLCVETPHLAKLVREEFTWINVYIFYMKFQFLFSLFKKKKAASFCFALRKENIKTSGGVEIEILAFWALVM